MQYLVLHPEKGLCLVDGIEVLNTEEALAKYPTETQALMAAGDVALDCVFIGDKCYRGEPTFKFWINTDAVEGVSNILISEGYKVEQTEQNLIHILAYSEDHAKQLERRYPTWEVMYRLPDPSQAILNEQAIMEAVIEPEDEPQVIEEPPVEEEEPPVEEEPQVIEEEKAADDIGPIPEIGLANLTSQMFDAPKPVSQSYSSPKPLMDSINMGVLVPVPCKGETWAQTWENVHKEDVTDDSYCIENNWDKREDFWIIDCCSRGKRLIHSDKRNYNHEFNISDCEVQSG